VVLRRSSATEDAAPSPAPAPAAATGTPSRLTKLRKVGTKAPAAAAAPVVEPAPTAKAAAKVGGKGRPTPKRSSAQAANRRPLVPGDRKEAARAARAEAREKRLTARVGMLNGDERYLTPRDRGPVRRYVRDVVDGRFNIGENLILIALAILLLQLLVPLLLRSVPGAGPAVSLGGAALLYSTLLLIIGDSLLLRRRIRRGVAERFGPEAATERGLAFYGIMRSLQLRRGRTPGVAVARGQSPR
jgi:hypothetical protein